MEKKENRSDSRNDFRMGIARSLPSHTQNTSLFHTTYYMSCSAGDTLRNPFVSREEDSSPLVAEYDDNKTARAPTPLSLLAVPLRRCWQKNGPLILLLLLCVKSYGRGAIRRDFLRLPASGDYRGCKEISYITWTQQVAIIVDVT